MIDTLGFRSNWLNIAKAIGRGHRNKGCLGVAAQEIKDKLNHKGCLGLKVRTAKPHGFTT
jgi:hypothetical protein